MISVIGGDDLAHKWMPLLQGVWILAGIAGLGLMGVWVEVTKVDDFSR